MAWTEERKEKQREIAKSLVEQGRFGGAGRGQGRKRLPRASERVAERISGKGDEMFERLWQTFMDGTDANSIAAYRELRTVEETERKLELQDEQSDVDDMKRDEVVELLKSLVREGIQKGVIPEEIIGDAELVAIERSSSFSEEATEGD